ncbi:MAG: helix-turn-helix domain-containing protein [Bernardetiaceae bacterium]|nr:helix-turn-helix domain-containing protein [Bernardetiaceae bacterium]
MKIYTLEEVQNQIIGHRGTPERELFEYELQLEQIGAFVKAARKKRKLTQEQFGQDIGITTADIVTIEENTTEVAIGTLLKVLAAINATIQLQLAYTE